MPMSSHDSLHQFATLRLKTYILARKERELLVACRPPRGLTPRMVYGGYTPPPPCGPVMLGCGVARVCGIVCFCVAGGVLCTPPPPPVALWWPCGAGIHAYMHTYIHTYIRTYIHTYMQTYKHTHIHTNTHTYIHTYRHTDIHTYTTPPPPCGPAVLAYMHTYIHTTTSMQCIASSSKPRFQYHTIRWGVSTRDTRPYMYACMYVCMHVCMYARMYVCRHVCSIFNYMD